MRWLWLPSTCWDRQPYAISLSGHGRTTAIEWKTAIVSRWSRRPLPSPGDCFGYLPSRSMSSDASSLPRSLSILPISYSFPITARSHADKLARPPQRGPKAPAPGSRWRLHLPNRCLDTAAKSLATVIVPITPFVARRPCCWHVGYCESSETSSSCLEGWFWVPVLSIEETHQKVCTPCSITAARATHFRQAGALGC